MLVLVPVDTHRSKLGLKGAKVPGVLPCLSEHKGLMFGMFNLSCPKIDQRQVIRIKLLVIKEELSCCFNKFFRQL